ncbi:hypothetical protein ACJROX_26085 [Pseudalkalibacillus sp. A8]|uniref:hypothetical protein n=1 Tax=Pseudalkalibacillus sp. A8 TaxID=3382641 RepID=UPI0038B43946
MEAIGEIRGIGPIYNMNITFSMNHLIMRIYYLITHGNWFILIISCTLEMTFLESSSWINSAANLAASSGKRRDTIYPSSTSKITCLIR